ncbi:MAG: alpha/beta hydrolase [Planctomycetia bacterium]|nr:alpha/beta hydrolase [Planctomycetia bacterium]
MKTPLFLFPGLACNERLFTTQKFGLDNMLNVIVPAWIRPTSRDQIDTFALRWAEYLWETYYSENALPENRLDASLGCYVGGHCFGGMVAPFVGEYLDKKGVRVHGCFRFASADSRSDIPSKWRILGRMLNFFPDGAWLTIKAFCYFRLNYTGKIPTSQAKTELYQQVVESPVRRGFHVVRMLYSWNGEMKRSYNFPLLCIRGAKDTVIPPNPYAQGDIIVLPHAGHGMMVTQGAKLNDLIRNFVVANT